MQVHDDYIPSARQPWPTETETTESRLSVAGARALEALGAARATMRRFPLLGSFVGWTLVLLLAFLVGTLYLAPKIADAAGLRTAPFLGLDVNSHTGQPRARFAHVDEPAVQIVPPARPKPAAPPAVAARMGDQNRSAGDEHPRRRSHRRRHASRDGGAYMASGRDAIRTEENGDFQPPTHRRRHHERRVDPADGTSRPAGEDVQRADRPDGGGTENG